MSRNLVEIIRRHHDLGAPTALEVLKDALERDEVQGAFALTATGRGLHANVAAGLDAGFRSSTCVSCGACADTCPTDAIIEISLLAII